MTKTEFIEAVKMINEDKEKAISIYGDPETWSAPGISNISIAKSTGEILEPSEFEIKFNGFKEVDEKTKVYDVVKLIENNEVYIVVKHEFVKDAYYQNKNDSSKLTDFGCLKRVLDYEMIEYGVFNPLKEIHSGNIVDSYNCCVLPAKLIMNFLSKMLYDKDGMIRAIHERLNKPSAMPCFDSDQLYDVCESVSYDYLDYIFDETYKHYDTIKVVDCVKRIYLDEMFTNPHIEEKPLSHLLLTELKKNINKINELSVFELIDNGRFYAFTDDIYNYIDMIEYDINLKEEYSWNQIYAYDASQTETHVSFIYK
jgi:hypothetical protein